MNILVTGVTGLVGNLVARRLASQGHKVRGMVRNSQRTGTLREALNEVVEGDVERPETFEHIAEGIDSIVHCAGLVGSGRGTEDDYMRINAEGTRSLLRVAREAGVQRFVFMSTVGVYGTHVFGGNIKEDTPYQSSTGYTASKIAAEQTLRAFGVPYVILRPYWITGGGDRFLIPQVAYLLKNGTFTYIGKGDQEWSLSAAENVGQAAALAAVHPQAANRIYNVADATVKVKDTVDIIAQTLGVPQPTRHSSVVGAAFRSLLNRSPDNPAHMTVDLFSPLFRSITINSDRIRTELGWEPEVPWQDSLRAGTLEWKQKNWN